MGEEGKYILIDSPNLQQLLLKLFSNDHDILLIKTNKVIVYIKYVNNNLEIANWQPYDPTYHVDLILFSPTDTKNSTLSDLRTHHPDTPIVLAKENCTNQKPPECFAGWCFSPEIKESRDCCVEYIYNLLCGGQILDQNLEYFRKKYWTNNQQTPDQNIMGNEFSSEDSSEGEDFDEEYYGEEYQEYYEGDEQSCEDDDDKPDADDDEQNDDDDDDDKQDDDDDDEDEDWTEESDEDTWTEESSEEECEKTENNEKVSSHHQIDNPSTQKILEEVVPTRYKKQNEDETENEEKMKKILFLKEDGNLAPLLKSLFDCDVDQNETNNTCYVIEVEDNPFRNITATQDCISSISKHQKYDLLVVITNKTPIQDHLSSKMLTYTSSKLFEAVVEHISPERSVPVLFVDLNNDEFYPLKPHYGDIGPTLVDQLRSYCRLLCFDQFVRKSQIEQFKNDIELVQKIKIHNSNRMLIENQKGIEIQPTQTNIVEKRHGYKILFLSEDQQELGRFLCENYGLTIKDNLNQVLLRFGSLDDIGCHYPDHMENKSGVILPRFIEQADIIIYISPPMEIEIKTYNIFHQLKNGQELAKIYQIRQDLPIIFAKFSIYSNDPEFVETSLRKGLFLYLDFTKEDLCYVRQKIESIIFDGDLRKELLALLEYKSTLYNSYKHHQDNIMKEWSGLHETSFEIWNEASFESSLKDQSSVENLSLGDPKISSEQPLISVEMSMEKTSGDSQPVTKIDLISSVKQIQKNNPPDTEKFEEIVEKLVYQVKLVKQEFLNSDSVTNQKCSSFNSKNVDYESLCKLKVYRNKLIQKLLLTQSLLDSGKNSHIADFDYELFGISYDLDILDSDEERLKGNIQSLTNTKKDKEREQDELINKIKDF